MPRPTLSYFSQSSFFQGLFGGVLLTIAFFLPFWSQLSSHLPSLADGLLISYLINWPRLALQMGRGFYDLPLFYPFEQTLAYAEPYLSTGLLSSLAFLFTDNLILIQNLHLLVGTVIVYASMYWLVLHLTSSKTAAILAAIFFTVSPLHLHYWVHLHSYLLAGLPLTLLFTLKWFDQKRLIFLVLTGFSFLYQALNDPMTGFFILACYLPLIWGLRSNLRSTKTWLPLLSLWLVVILSSLWFYWPYFQVSAEFNYTRSIRDTAHFAHSLNQFLQPALLIWSLIMAWLWFVPRARKLSYIQPQRWWIWVVITAIGGILMLGPVVKVSDQTLKVFDLPIPLPYALAYYMVPGFKAFRDSSRWIVILNFGLALLLGELASRRQLTKISALSLVLGLSLVLWTTQVPQMRMTEINRELPEIYTYLTDTPGQVIAELPVFSWRMTPYSFYESYRLLYQTQHQQILYNGTSGFTPLAREEEWDWLWATFPSPESLSYFKAEGVQVLMVHFDIYHRLRAENYTFNQIQTLDPEWLREELAKNPLLEMQKCIPSACIYTIK